MKAGWNDQAEYDRCRSRGVPLIRSLDAEIDLGPRQAPPPTRAYTTAYSAVGRPSTPAVELIKAPASAGDNDIATATAMDRKNPYKKRESRMDDAAGVLSAVPPGRRSLEYTAPYSINNVNVIALIDSGATATCLDTAYARARPGTFEVRAAPCRVQLTDEVEVEASGRCKIEIRGQGPDGTVKRATVDAYLLKTGKEPLLIGTDVFPALGIEITGLSYQWPSGPAHAPYADRIPDEVKGHADDFNMHAVDSIGSSATAYTDGLWREEHRYGPEVIDKLMADIAPAIERNQATATELCTHPLGLIDLDTGDQAPHWTYQYPLSRDAEAALDTAVDKWLSNGVIGPAPDTCRYNNAMLVVPKRAPDRSITKWRPCIDPRRTNEGLRYKKYPIPKIAELLRRLAGFKIASSLDLLSGYHQLPLTPPSREKTAFTVKGRRYVFFAAPFGFANLPQAFQCLMENVLMGYENITLVFLDDVLVFSKTIEAHAAHVIQTIDALTKWNLTLNLEKSHFGYKKLLYLGHLLSGQGRSPDPQKVASVKRWPIPTEQSHGRDIGRFLGFCNFLRDYVPLYATVAAPLERLRRLKRLGAAWDDKALLSFTTLRDVICTGTVLTFPVDGVAFVVSTDASQYGIGAVLYQTYGSPPRAHYNAFFSKPLRVGQINYGATRRELLAVVSSLQRFRQYLWGQRFTLKTDHRALIYLHTQADLNYMLRAWLDVLLDFQFDIVYSPGCLQVLPDALSRLFSDTFWEGVMSANHEIFSRKKPEIRAITRARSKLNEKNPTELKILTSVGDSFDEKAADNPAETYSIDADGKATTSTTSPKGDKRSPRPVGPRVTFAKELMGPTAPRTTGQNESHLISAMKPGRVNTSQLSAKPVSDLTDVDAQLNDLTPIRSGVWGQDSPQQPLAVIPRPPKQDGKAKKFGPQRYPRQVTAVATPRLSGAGKMMADASSKNESQKAKGLASPGVYGSMDCTEDGIHVQEQPPQAAVAQPPNSDPHGDEKKELEPAIALDELVHWPERQLVGHIRDVFDKKLPPVADRPGLVEAAHSAGHWGSTLVYKRLWNQGLFWPGMKIDCTNHCSRCLDCLRFNTGKFGYHPAQPIEARLPNDHAAVDLAQLPTSVNGYNYVFVYVDIATDYVVLLPLKDKCMTTIAAALWYVFCWYGAPKILSSDNGSEWVNQIVEAFNDLIGVDHRTILPYKPESNGQTEGKVKVAKLALNKSLRGLLPMWDLFIPGVMAGINSKDSAGRKTPPFTLFLGRARNPYTVFQGTRSSPLSEAEIIKRHKQMDELIHPEIYEMMHKTKYKAARKRNAKRRQVKPLKVGTEVMLLNQTRDRKTEARWLGPYTIVDVSKRSKAAPSYQLIDGLRQLLKRRVPIQQLKPLADVRVLPKNLYLPKQVTYAPVAETDNESKDDDSSGASTWGSSRSYAVDRILQHRRSADGTDFEYLVKWLNWQGDPTWEPSAMFDTTECLSDYWSQSTDGLISTKQSSPKKKRKSKKRKSKKTSSSS